MESLKQIGDIRIFAELQRGPVAQVYKGYQDSLERFVLLKVLHPELSRDAALAQRFEEEAKFIARVQHQNVVAIHDYGRHRDWHYFVTEFVEGWELTELIPEDGMPWELAAFVVLEVAKGLKAAHDKGLLHKDIKPANILVSNSGQVKLTDFGLAALAQTRPEKAESNVCGTLGFIPPEVVLGEEPDTASDIFSLGVTFFELLTGTAAFQHDDIPTYFDAVLKVEPIHYVKRQTSIPDKIAELCGKMLSRNRQQRYAECGQLIHDLEVFFSEYAIKVGEERLLSFLKEPDSYQPETLSQAASEEPAAHNAESEASDDGFKSYGKKYSYFLAVVLFVLAVGWMSAFVIDFETGAGSAADNSGVPTQKSAAETPPFSSAKSEPSINSDAAPENSETLKENDREFDAVNQAIPAENSTNSHPEETEPEVVTERGFLNLQCTPWAIVYINGDSLGPTPLNQPLELNTGYHQLRLVNPEFPDYETRVKIADGQTNMFEVSFWDHVGQLHLEISPWAVVFVDGDSVDTIPPQQRPVILEPGAHQLMLKHPVLGEWRTEFSISAGENLNLKFNLRNLLDR